MTNRAVKTKLCINSPFKTNYNVDSDPRRGTIPYGLPWITKNATREKRLLVHFALNKHQVGEPVLLYLALNLASQII